MDNFETVAGRETAAALSRGSCEERGAHTLLVNDKRPGRRIQLEKAFEIVPLTETQAGKSWKTVIRMRPLSVIYLAADPKNPIG